MLTASSLLLSAFVIFLARLLHLGYGCVHSMAAGSITYLVLLVVSVISFFRFDSLALGDGCVSFEW